MISQLRKRHFRLWVALAVTLPLGFVAAYRGIPTPLRGSLPDLNAEALPTLLAASETADFRVSRRFSAQTGAQQLEVVLKGPLRQASALVYWRGDERPISPVEARLLGPLGAQGVYRFALPAGTAEKAAGRVLFYDKIKGEAFATFLLKP